MRRFCCIAASFCCIAASGAARASRPPQALLADKAAAEAEVHDLERRAHALGEQAAARKEQLKHRLRALYKLSSGGSLRLLFDSADRAELAARHDAMTRVLARDLDELAAVREEARELDSEQARRQDAISRALDLANQYDRQSTAAPDGMAARMGQLTRPVPGPILHSFGHYRERGIELARRGAELQAQPGQPVRAVAPGRVSWVGQAPGLGHAVAVDHGDGWVTLIARIHPSVSAGDEVAEGAVIGRAAETTVYFELTQGGTAIDPSPWMQRPR